MAKTSKKKDDIETAAMESYPEKQQDKPDDNESDTQVRPAVLMEDESPTNAAEEKVADEQQESNATENASKHSEQESHSDEVGPYTVSEPKESIQVRSEDPPIYHAETSQNETQQTSHSEPAKNPISKLAIVALLFAWAASCGVGYLWWLSQQQDTNETAELIDQIELTNRALSQAEQQIAQQSQDFKDLQALLRKQNQSIEFLQSSLIKLQAKQTGEVNYWRYQEAQYLLQTATLKLAVERDANTAISLLEAASAKLAPLPNSIAIQQAIANDIGVVRANYPVAPTQLLMQVESLQQQLMQLPLVNMTPSEVKERFEIEAPEKQQKDWWDKILDAISPAYSVIPVNRSLEPLLRPEERHYLMMNMTLALQQLQVAVQNGDEPLKASLITKLEGWISTYFDVKQASTMQFQQELVELKSIKLQSTPPQLQSATLIEQQLFSAKANGAN